MTRSLPFTPPPPPQVRDYADCAVLGQDQRIKDAIKLFSQCMGAYYPEFKGRTLLINIPDVYALLFRAASAFMPARTVAKFTLKGSGYHESLSPPSRPSTCPRATAACAPTRPTTTRAARARGAARPRPPS